MKASSRIVLLAATLGTLALTSINAFGTAPEKKPQHG